jgi:hypothetical protein
MVRPLEGGNTPIITESWYQTGTLAHGPHGVDGVTVMEPRQFG